jgi:hypothetical protein
MKNRFLLSLFASIVSVSSYAQTNPAITNWLQNTTQTGSYYMSGNSTTIDNEILVNCQKIEYSSDFVYVSTNGVPSYPTGPFLDNNPSNATAQNAIFKIPLTPRVKNGTKTPTTPGRIGVFINGVSLFDYRDGVAWNSSNNSLCGGPGNAMCPGGPNANLAWNRDAVPAEMDGFDCSKGHPANGNYHHHQNPSAFKLDVDVISSICNLYDADGLYTIDSTQHSPLIGFAYDGYPIYGAYGYKNSDGTGGIVRMKSGYQLGNYTVRTHYPDGTDVDDGPNVNATYFLGYFREDYQFVEHTNEEDYLDVHNGRFCITPEYPNGTYAYFCTVDENWNSAYPYAVGPTFYGVYANRLVTSIDESTEDYDPTTEVSNMDAEPINLSIISNPTSDLLTIQVHGVLKVDLSVELYDMMGKKVKQSTCYKGQTIAFMDLQTIYNGNYIVKIQGQGVFYSQNIQVDKN